MLDPFGVGLRRLARRADRDEEVDHQPVALTRFFRHRGARLGQEDAPIGLRAREPLALEAGDGLAGRGMRDAHAPRDVGRTRFAIGGDEIGDQLGIVLEHRGRTRRARLAEPVGLRGLGRQSRMFGRWLNATLRGRQIALARPAAISRVSL